MELEQMLDLLWDQFYWPWWPRMWNFTLQGVSDAFDSNVNHKGQKMENIQATYPLKLVHLDYLTIETTKGGNDVHVLIITDHFMRYAQALVTAWQTANWTAQALLDQSVVHYGLPESLIYDNGWNLKVISFQNCASWQKSRSYILVCTIHKQMDNVNSLIVHW